MCAPNEGSDRPIALSTMPRIPAPPVTESGDAIEPRARAAWRTWLTALATDAEAAVAAALTYEALDATGRDAWLDVLDQDAPTIDVPAVALYAPLMAVESDEGRRARIERAMGEGRAVLDHGARAEAIVALRGTTDDGACVCALLAPMYLDFVQVLTCVYRPDSGVSAAYHDPLRSRAEAPKDGGRPVEGAVLEKTPLRVVVEELAHAIVADRRERRDPPVVLERFVDLFGLDFESAEDGAP